MFFTFASLFSAVFFFAQFLQIGLGYSPLEAGLRLMPWTATFITVAPVAGALADRIGERPLMVVGLSLQAVGMGWLALIAEPGLAYSQHARAADRRRRRHLDGDPGRAELGGRLGRGGCDRQGGGDQQHDARARRRVRDRGRRRRVRGGGQLRVARAFVDGFAPAIGVGAGLALAGAAAGLALPGRAPPAQPPGIPAIRRSTDEQVMVRYKVKPDARRGRERGSRVPGAGLRRAAPRRQRARPDFRYATFRLQTAE